MTEIVVALIGGQSAILAALIQRASRRAGRAEARASEASRQTVATGNGHAARVETALHDIRQDLGGLRAEMRAERSSLRAVDDRLKRLEMHHGKAD